MRLGLLIFQDSILYFYQFMQFQTPVESSLSVKTSWLTHQAPGRINEWSWFSHIVSVRPESKNKLQRQNQGCPKQNKNTTTLHGGRVGH